MIFKIKKGRHFSNQLIHKLVSSFHNSDRLSYYCIFTDTLYTDTTVDRFDVNKLFGFSIGMHHVNSYRFGWNVLDDKIHIYAYSYINSQCVIDEICIIEKDKEYKFIIKINNGKAFFSVIDEEYCIKQVIQSAPLNKFIGYHLWPYFGGNKTPPKDIFIELIEF
jgi:hypothetical protein